MSDAVIKVDQLSKCYQLGSISRHTLVEEVEHLLLKLRRKNPRQHMGKLDQCTEQGTKEFWALKNVSFEVRRGEVLGIIGGNGAGKSTLLKILSRITEPTNGTAEIRGRVGSLLEVGTGFHPELTGRENVFMNGTLLGMRKWEVAKKFDEIVNFSGVEKFIDTPVKRYSSGMYVRLAFAVAAHLDPEILIVDEVLAVGDADFQKKCLGKMNDVAKAGRTVLFVSHNMAAVNNLCGSCLFMKNGSIERLGPTKEVIQSYLMNDATDSTEQEDLSLRTSRTGSGTVQLKRFMTLDEHGAVRQNFQSGERICFQFVLQKNNVGETVKNVDLGFSIHDYSTGNTLSVIYASYQNAVIDISQEELTLQCWIEDFPFSAARYLIGARVVVDGRESDWLQEKVGYIDIIEGDFFRTGQKGFKGNAPLLLRGTWKSRNRENEI